MVRFTKCDCIHPIHKLVSAPLVGWARKKGLRINAWTVNEEADVKRLLLLGVDGLITDDPAYVRSVAQKNIRYQR